MSADQPAALVTDASQRVALHVIRALGRKGVSVHAVEVEGWSGEPMGFVSRYAAHTSLIPAWGDTSEDWLRGLLAAGQPGDVLLPCCLNTILRVLAHREALEGKYRIVLAPEATLRRVNNKAELWKMAQGLGLPLPATYHVRDLSEVRDLTGSLEYPVIVKFRHDEDLYLPGAARYRRADSPEALIAAWQHLHAVQPEPLIQQFIDGPGYGFEALYGPKGGFLAGFAHRRLVEFPPGGGPSAVCRTAHDSRLVELGRRLLDGVGWQGVAMVEFKKSVADGEFYLLEVNPRFWGSLPLSEAAGVNFPHLLYLAAIGEPSYGPERSADVTMRLLPTCLASVLQSFRAKPWAVRRWLGSARYLFDPRVREGLVSCDDLRPVRAYLRQRARGV